MSYLDRLRLKISAKVPDVGATKVSKGAFVPFVAGLSAPLRQINAGLADDRIKCEQCAYLRRGKCAQAATLGASWGYAPISDLARRCECFKPFAGAADQRGGLQRWPALIHTGGK